MNDLACDRNGCTNIMCDRYSNLYGCICNECFEEMVVFIADGGSDIEDFMESEKKDIPPKGHIELARNMLSDEFRM